MRRPTVRARAVVGALLTAGAMLLGRSSKAFGHPLHTTITELVYHRENRTVRATIRVFADDLRRAVLGLPASATAPAASAVSNWASSDYVRSHFTITAPDGRTLPLRWCGVRRSADLVWVCVEAAWSAALRGMRVHNRMLFELYHDQVNIVQASYDGARESLLFTKGEGPKRLS